MKNVKKYVNWEEFDKLCNKVAAEIFTNTNRYPKFNIIMTPARGGLVASRIIAEKLSINEIHTFGLKAYDKDVPLDELELYQEPNMHFFPGMRVLLIDDIADSGKTLTFLKDWFTDKKLEDLTICTIHYKQQCTVKPDFYAEKIENNTWVVYPYEFDENRP